MGTIGTRVIQAVRSAVVPPLCVSCREPELSGHPLCSACRLKLKPVEDPRCARCGAPGIAWQGCPECCDRELAFDCAWSGFEYEGVARDLVGALKTRELRVAAGAMAQAIVRYVPPNLISWALVPVPAHASRSRRHGFNHAADLARELKFQLGGAVAPWLARRGSTKQTGKLRGERIASASESVVLAHQPRDLHSVTLIDDVYTTGATLDACARALRGAGVERINAVTFARAGKY